MDSLVDKIVAFWRKLIEEQEEVGVSCKEVSIEVSYIREALPFDVDGTGWVEGTLIGVEKCMSSSVTWNKDQLIIIAYKDIISLYH